MKHEEILQQYRLVDVLKIIACSAGPKYRFDKVHNEIKVMRRGLKPLFEFYVATEQYLVSNLASVQLFRLLLAT